MNDDKPMELRDQLALGILNGMLSNDEAGKYIINDLRRRLLDHEFPEQQKKANELATDLIRTAYAIADIMRKVRMTAFE